MTFGEFIKKLRDEKNYSIRKLALKSGVSFGQISKIENNKRGVPKPETIKKLAKGLDADYDQLMNMAGYIKDEEAEDTTELTKFLKKANVMFHGQPLTKQDKQRVEDVLTALFWDAHDRKTKGEETNNTSESSNKTDDEI